MMAELDILNGFAGKVISDCIDISINAIKKADKNRKAKNQTVETRIYQVIVDSLNYFTYNKYKENDKLYYASESIFKGLKSGKSNAEAIKSGLKMLISDVNNDTCQDFLRTVCREICRDENNDLYKEIVMVRQEQGLEDLKKITQNQNDSLGMLGDIKEDTRYIRESLSKKETHGLEHCNEVPIENRADEYVKKWDKNVFLNDFNKRDKDAGVNIKLKDIYLEEHLPHYKWKSDGETLTDLKTLLKEYIIDNDEKKMLLILGQPGIGKSTLITWIMANLVENRKQMLVYQFASDLGKVDWQSDNILNETFKAIGYSYRELEGKTLILDGFDEIHINGDRERILHKLHQELEKTNYLNKISLIITCRENYVDKKELIGVEYITLQAWDKKQIRSFCETYEKKNAKNRLEIVNNKKLQIRLDKILKNKEVFGIPLILYMVLALNIDIEKNSSMVDIYDQIFSLKRGGIYDRCYDREHRINSPEIKIHIHQISQRIAFWMFENKADKASIPQGKFKEICDAVMAKGRNEDIQRDVLIGNYFASIKYCEGVETDELQFVHRSIYEYFVVMYFFESIKKVKDRGNDKIKAELEELLKTGYLSKQISEFVAGKLGELLKDGLLSEQILEFIKYKFDSMKGYNLSNVTREVFDIMLRDGMTYYIKVEGKLNNVIEREKNIFLNMLRVVGLWNIFLGKLSNRIIIYLQCNRQNDLDLQGIKLGLKKGDMLQESDIVLKELFIRKENLFIANLSRSYLCGANLSKADLNEVDLSEANLKGANLSGANLNRVNLSRADLSGADLRGVNLSTTDLFGANLSGTIFD